MSNLNSERHSVMDESHRVLIDTTQGGVPDQQQLEVERAKLFSEGAQRPKLLS